MRPLFVITLFLALTGCSNIINQGLLPVPPSDALIAVGALGLMYSEELEEINEETLRNTKPSDALPASTKENVTRVANQVRDNAKATGRKLKNWWNYKKEQPKPHDIPDSYCYRTFGDVLCYRAPMPGWEARLVGYQGTTAEPPPVTVMTALPAKSGDESKLPANRLANAKPVFIEMPLDVKEEPKKDVVPEETVHENVDQTLSPQM